MIRLFMHEQSNQEISGENRLQGREELQKENYLGTAKANASRTNRITQKELMEILHYNPETGKFLYRKRMGARALAGATAGSPNSNGYWHIKINGILHKSHRLAWLYIHGEHPIGEVDHINHRKGDNRIANLRVGSKAENISNQIRAQKSSKSGILGVWWSKFHQKWASAIRVNSKHHHLGYFEDKETAAQCYLNAKRSLHNFCTL